MPPGPDHQLNRLLRDTSRSFYLTLRVLPGAIRPQIGLAYLLARATDTIADTPAVPLAERLAALDQLRQRILGASASPLDFARFGRDSDPLAVKPATATPAEHALLGRINQAVTVLDGFEDADRQRIREVLAIITGGQELDLRRFAGASEARIAGLANAAELEDYTYRVAGCVGEFWTRMCRAHVFPAARIDEARLLADGVRFGKGLQLVNILRDLPRDLRQGRCYLPEAELHAVGLAPADLLQPGNVGRLRPVYEAWRARALAHLAAGWDYTNALPFSQFRLRLACAWPVLLGARTLARLRDGNPLDPAQRIKVSRAELRRVLMRSLLAAPFRRIWLGQFARAAA